MERALTVVVLGTLVLGSAAMAPATAAAQAAATAQAPLAANASVKNDNRGAGLVDVPPLPRGKSTILGGQIRDIDQVRDQFVLHVYGEKPMRILYDGRTQVFRDGNRIPLHELSPAEHASVQTTLDGAKVFAVTVHILSQTPKGDFEGRILSYDAAGGILMLNASGSQEPFQVRVTPETAVTRQGQSSFTAENHGQADLVRGALVSLSFETARGQGTAKQITILATPGASFVFTGTVSSLNIAGGYVVVLDPRDQRSYQIRFNPEDPVVLKLHAGDHVRIAAEYDGNRYIATQISKP